MALNKEYQFKKLNDLLSTSFNNVKYDVRDIGGKIENLKTNFANFSTESVKTAFEEQTKLILEQQTAINQLNERINDLETRKPQTIIQQLPAPQVMREEPASRVFKTKESALSEVRKILREEGKLGTSEKSVYDIPEGQARITRVQFKARGNGKRNLNDEWVEITGYGADISGFMLHGKNKKKLFRFTEGFKIYGPVKVFTGKGRSTNTKIYWGKPRPMWNDKGDVATLKDKRGKIVSQVMSEPIYSFKAIR